MERKIKNKFYISTFLATLLFSGCGDDTSSSSNDNSYTPTQNSEETTSDIVSNETITDFQNSVSKTEDETSTLDFSSDKTSYGYFIRDNNKSVVLDTSTGLMWEDGEDVYGSSYSQTTTFYQSYEDGVYKFYLLEDDIPSSVTNYDTVDNWHFYHYCAILNTKSDKSGWRVPTLDELESIIDRSNNPTTAPIFKNTKPWTYWTSVHDYDDSYSFSYGNYYKIIDFRTGESEEFFYYGTSNHHAIRCVRSMELSEFIE
ncbi:Protein of unknown function (DUF1566) [Thiovulum sp. ES]|nr:Protein of unknown function (DUF1566) [Thiovulum sp. ES]